MKKLWKILVAVGVVAVLTAGPASAYLINFDNLAPNAIIDGVNLGGVTITSAPGFTQVKANGAAGAAFISPYNAITNYTAGGGLDGMITQPLSMIFDVPQSSIAFTGGDNGGDVDQFTVTVFDVNNVQLGQVITPVFGGKAPLGNLMVDQYTVQLNFLGGMKTVVVSDAINFGIAIDNLQFCEIAQTPLPPTALLLGSALVGLLGLRRRFNS
jgi:hypothetical protein